MKVTSNILEKNFKNTFLSCEQDQELIWRRLFVESRPYSEKLKRLLVVNAPDCLDETKKQYDNIVHEMSLKDLKDKKYLRVVPKLAFGEHEEVKSYILLEFDDYLPTENPKYRDCTISITVICHLDYWEMEDYKLRPHQIAGYIDGLLNESRLTGIGTLNFIGASQVILSEYLGGVVLQYIATHGGDDEENLNSTLPSDKDI